MSEQNPGSSDRPRRRRRRRRRGGGGGEGDANRGGGQGGGGQAGGGAGRGRRRGRGGSGGGGGRGGPSGFAQVPPGDPDVEVSGILQLSEKGHGFLRSPTESYSAEPGDTVVPRSLVSEFALEDGVEIRGMAVGSERKGQPAVLAKIDEINHGDMEAWGERQPFKDLVAESPHERIRLEAESDGVSTRVVDLIAPIGKGQRCLIVAPPKAGKTVLLQQIAHSVTTNHPEIKLIVLLVDERPEEVTDMRRSVKGEVIASSSDESPRNHVNLAEMALERAKRIVEGGGDVVILLDSITRLARAYNSEQRGSGRVLSGGIDARTMEKPRRFFGAARKCEGGGSLTVIATALIDTGSRMDEVIFQEFKGTGNTEIVLDRRLFEMRIFPAIDIAQSGTRKEEMLLTDDEYQKVTLLRRALAPLRAAEAMKLLTGRIAQQPSNEAFLASLI